GDVFHAAGFTGQGQDLSLVLEGRMRFPGRSRWCELIPILRPVSLLLAKGCSSVFGSVLSWTARAWFKKNSKKSFCESAALAGRIKSAKSRLILKKSREFPNAPVTDNTDVRSQRSGKTVDSACSHSITLKS
ncbi:MAG: hypothetical protein MI861_22110, partial [Pirellulales bacterium]|nr:hypothetical protein [Pirellulales bacterium]